MNKLSIRDLDLSGKRVFIRVDFNVPIKDGHVDDDTRIRAALPTINYATSHDARVILASHLGRPKGQPVDKYSLRPVADHLAKLLGKSVAFADDCIGPTAAEKVGRKIRIGTHFYIVARASEASAQAAAERLLSRVAAAATLAPPDSATAAMIQIAPGFWDGMKRLSPQPAPMIVGSYQQVAETLQRLSANGLSCFILHGYPSAAEATRVAENVLPRLR